MRKAGSSRRWLPTADERSRDARSPLPVAHHGGIVRAKRATQAHVDSRSCTLGRAVRSVFHAVDAHVVVGFTPQSTFSRSQLVRTSDGYQRRALTSSLDIFGYQVRCDAHHEGCGGGKM